MTNQTVLITGASSGMGYDIARGFYEQGANLVLNGRNADKLSDAGRAPGDAERIATVPGDIGDKETGVNRYLSKAFNHADSAAMLENRVLISRVPGWAEQINISSAFSISIQSLSAHTAVVSPGGVATSSTTSCIGS